MGTVYEAVQRTTAAPRAVKIMRGAIAGDLRFRARFELEARVSSRIPSDHVVQVVSAEDYSKWVAAQKAKMAAAADDPTKVWELAELKQRGERVYAANCAACHQASGAGVPNAFPGLVQSKVVLGPAAEQIQLVLHGRKGVFAPTSVMPGMGTLSDVDIAAAITYTRHAWGNNAAEGLVQPAQVKAARAAK